MRMDSLFLYLATTHHYRYLDGGVAMSDWIAVEEVSRLTCATRPESTRMYMDGYCT